MTYAGVGFVPFFFTTFIDAWVRTGAVRWSWFWVFVTGFVVVERVWSVKRGGWRSLLLAGLVVPEILYDLFLHGVYIKVLTDMARHERETWDHIKPAEVIGRRSIRLCVKRAAGPAYSLLLLAAVVGLALVCDSLGVAWSIIAALVLAGAALAALRLSGLDPCGILQGTGEPATLHHSVGAPTHQGFGGVDVPSDALATAGGEGTHHWLNGGAGVRNPRVTSSEKARRSRQATSAWLAESRRTELQAVSLAGRLGAGVQ
jgi:hypothetical protein